MVRTGERGPEGHFLHRGREGHAGALVRRAGEEARLEVAADRDGDVRELPRAGRQTSSAAKGEGFKIAMAGLDGGRLNIAACSIGGAQFCLDRTIDYMRERKQFGSRLVGFPGAAIPHRRLCDRARGRAADGAPRRASRSSDRRARRDAACRDGQAPRDRCRLRGRSTAACNCTAATAICATIRSSACCATCACTRSSKAPTRSCG